MKRLTLIRHANSAQTIGQSDFDRTLSETGNQEALLMGQWLKTNQVTFDQVYCSAAQRAMETAKTLCLAMDYPKHKIITKLELYDFDMNSIYHYIEAIDDRYHNVAIIGHNPALSDLSAYLCSSFARNLPTCSIIQFDLDISEWVQISALCAKLSFFKHPGNLLTNE